MSQVAAVILVAAIVSSWLGAFAFLRLKTPFERLHALAFVNVVTLGLLALAGLVGQGINSLTLKCALIWAVNLVAGALISHAVGRAVHLRGGAVR